LKTERFAEDAAVETCQAAGPIAIARSTLRACGASVGRPTMPQRRLLSARFVADFSL